MPITFRHDAAGVVPPSNQSTRKYGQSLVMQQQQQKYAAQQAGYGRMFDAYKMENQNQVQQQRDWQQRNFVLNRDRDQNKLQQEQMEAERQRKFMDEARKASSGMIMEDINNGNYDAATARKLRENLVAESEALGNPNLDATQRAEALAKIRAARATLTANRIEKPPAPTPEEEIARLPEINGTKYQKNPKTGVWEPLQQSKAQQQQEKQQEQQLKLQEQEAKQMRPMSAQEYYSQNEDKFQKDLDSTMKVMQSEFDLGTRKEPVTQEAAWEKMQKDHDFRQKALGKPQYGEPTVAGQPDPGAAPPASPGTERSILEPPQAPTQPGVAPPAIQGEPSSILDAPIPSQKAEYHADMTAKGYKLITPPDGGRPYYYHDGTKETEDVDTAESASQNPWEDVAGGDPSATGRIPYDVPQRSALSQTVGQTQQPPQPGQAGDAAANYPWLKQPGQLMSENKTSQASSPITIETASSAAKQYETASQQLQTLQSQVDAIDGQIRGAKGKGGRSGILSANQNQRLTELKKEQQRIKAEMQSKQKMMQDADKAVRSYYDQEVAKQPAVQALAKAGKRPQDFAEAEFQLRNLRKQYPDMSSMPPEAKKQLQDAMAVIQAGR